MPVEIGDGKSGMRCVLILGSTTRLAADINFPPAIPGTAITHSHAQVAQSLTQHESLMYMCVAAVTFCRWLMLPMMTGECACEIKSLSVPRIWYACMVSGNKMNHEIVSTRTTAWEQKRSLDALFASRKRQSVQSAAMLGIGKDWWGSVPCLMMRRQSHAVSLVGKFLRSLLTLCSWSWMITRRCIRRQVLVTCRWVLNQWETGGGRSHQTGLLFSVRYSCTGTLKTTSSRDALFLCG